MAARIYIIDDDPGAAASASDALRFAGYTITHLQDPEALAQACAPPTGCILLDLGGAGRERLATVRMLGKQGIGWPVIATSVLADVRVAAWSLHAGASDFIVKPFDCAELLEIVKSASALLD